MRTALTVLGLIVTLASPARADLIVIDPNDFAPGTDLSNLFPGLSMARITNLPNSDGPLGLPSYQPIYSPVSAVSSGHVPAGLLSLGGVTYNLNRYDPCATRGWGEACREGWEVLELVFDSPTEFVSIDTNFNLDTPELLAFDILGNHLDLTVQGTRQYTYSNVLQPGPSFGNMTVNRNSADIARIVYGGNVGYTTPIAVSYRVPEPTTLGLLGIGLVCTCLYGARRGRRGRSTSAIEKEVTSCE